MVVLQSVESRNPNNFGGFFGYVAVCFVGGFIGGTLWSVPAVIASIYLTSAAYNSGVNLPSRTGDAVEVAILFVVFMALSGAIVAAGVWLSRRTVPCG